MASNYGRVAARVHYILKYSCALTIASKMKLNTLRKVYNKYGKKLTVKDEKRKVMATYPTASYKKTKIPIKLDKNCTPDNLVDKLSQRIHRGRKDLEGNCHLCGAISNIEVHHVKSLRKGPKKPDFLTSVMIRMNRKQIPLCESCHNKTHAGKL